MSRVGSEQSTGVVRGRWPWLVVAALLTLASACTAASTWLHWKPCRGMGPGGSTMACLQRQEASLPFPMPTDPTQREPWTSELGAAAMLLCAMSWMLLVLASTLSARLKLIALLGAVQPAVLGVTAAVAARGPEVEGGMPSLWWFAAGELTAIVLVVLGVRRRLWSPRETLRIVAVLCGVTAFGFLHTVGEYFLFLLLRPDAVDTPPLMGLATALTLLVCAAVTAGAASRMPDMKPAVPVQPAAETRR